MRNKYITGVAVLVLAGMPLAAQKVVRVQRPSTAPMVAEYESSSPRSYLGVGVADLSSERVQALKLKDDRGVEITQVDQDAPAGKAGLKEHDVIITFNGTPVEGQEQFKRLMRETPPGRTVSLDIMRDGQPQNVKVQVADRKKLESSVFPHEPGEFAYVMPPMPPVPAMPDFPRAWNEQTITRVRSNSGATLESLTSQLGDYFGVKNGEGMLVRSVQKGSAAEAAGLRAGDVIVRVGDKKITDNSDWRDALRSSKDGKVVVVVVRDRKEQTLSLAVPVRRGPDSSALYRDDCPETEMALEKAADTLDQVEPSVEQGVEAGLDAASEVLSSPELSDAINKAMNELHRQLIDNRTQINRSIANSMKVASTQLKAHSTEIEQAMHKAQRDLANIHLQFATEMQ
jgi:membrane-associated protease RseP (regulator of RpoE activity)